MTQNQASLDRNLKKRILTLAEPMEPLETDVSPSLASLESIKAVLLDVYGTMLISNAGEVGTATRSDTGNQAIFQAFDSLGISYEPALREEELFSEVKALIREQHQQMTREGNPSPEVNILNIWRQFFEKLEAEEKIREHPSQNDDLLQKVGVEFEMRYNPCWPMPHITATLQQLMDRKLTLGIISNSQFYTPLALEALLGSSLKELGFSDRLLYWSFEHALSKPAIEFYEPAAETLLNSFEITPDEVLYIGNDMLNDIYPANEIGFRTALFAGDSRSLRLREQEERTRNLSPDLVLTDFSQLPDCIL